MTARLLVASLALVLTAFTVPVGAQLTRLDVSIPYEFTIGTRKLAAGQYLITRPVPTDPHLLGFRGAAKHQKAVVSTTVKTSDEPAADTELIFARYGEAYFLRTVRIRGLREYYEISMSKDEKAVAAKGEAVMVSLKVEGH